MRDEELLKDVFRRATHGEPGVGDAFIRFERHERRTAIARFATVATVAVVSAILLTRLLPGVSSGPEEDTFIPGGADSGEPQNSNAYKDPLARLRVNYPIDWIARGTSGAFVEFFPQFGLEIGPELSSQERRRVACGKNCGPLGTLYTTEEAEQFFIKIDVLRPGCRDVQPGCARANGLKEFDAELRDAGARLARTTDFVAGKRVLRIDTAFSRSPKKIKRGASRLPPHYWCEGCLMRELVVPWDSGRTVYVRIVSPDAEDFERFSHFIEFTVKSIAEYDPTKTS